MISVLAFAFIVEGKEWTSWHSSRGDLPKSTNAQNISLIIYKNKNDSYTVKVTGQKQGRHYQVRIAQLGMNIVTDVASGENSGKRLTHDFAVLNWQSEKLPANASEVSFQLAAPKQKTPHLAIAAWIEEDGNLTPLQSVGGYL